MIRPLRRPDAFAEPRPMYATCDAGHEELLADELRALGAEHTSPMHRGVGFFGMPADEHHVGAGGGEPGGHRQSQSFGAARDDSGFSGEVELLDAWKHGISVGSKWGG